MKQSIATLIYPINQHMVLDETISKVISALYTNIEDTITKQIVDTAQQVANECGAGFLLIDKSVIIEMIELYNEKHKGEPTDDLFKR